MKSLFPTMGGGFFVPERERQERAGEERGERREKRERAECS